TAMSSRPQRQALLPGARRGTRAPSFSFGVQPRLVSELDTVRAELEQELWTQGRRAQGLEELPRPRPPLLGRPRAEEVLQRDDVPFHPGDLRDVRDAARAVDEAREMNQQVEAARNLLAHSLDRQLYARHQDEHLEAMQCIARRVGV